MDVPRDFNPRQLTVLERLAKGTWYLLPAGNSGLGGSMGMKGRRYATVHVSQADLQVLRDRVIFFDGEAYQLTVAGHRCASQYAEEKMAWYKLRQWAANQAAEERQALRKQLFPIPQREADAAWRKSTAEHANLTPYERLRIGVGLREATPAEAEHIAGCEFCQRTITAYRERKDASRDESP